MTGRSSPSPAGSPTPGHRVSRDVGCGPWTLVRFESGARAADGGSVTLSADHASTLGVRLLSHRLPLLYKVERHATEPCDGGNALPGGRLSPPRRCDGDIAVEGVVISGPGWDEHLRELMEGLSHAERSCLFAVRLADDT